MELTPPYLTLNKKRMKKLSIVFVALIAMLMIGCKKSEKSQGVKPSTELKPEMVVTAKDTVAVKQLCAQFFSKLKQKDLRGAVGMLRYYEADSVAPLPAVLEAKEATILGMFLGMKYDIDHIIFLKDYDSEVKYTVTMFDKTDPNDKRPNKTSFLIRPVRVRGQWYLTLADKDTDKVKSEIKH